MQKEQLDTKPWYRQFWPWFIIALPLTAVIASVTTLVIAIKYPDHLVIKKSDYPALDTEMLPAKKSGISVKTDKTERPD